jgi:hypothetical protein
MAASIINMYHQHQRRKWRISNHQCGERNGENININIIINENENNGVINNGNNNNEM